MSVPQKEKEGPASMLRAVFAGFAIYLWYRLVRDAWEREEEDREDSASTAAADVH